MWGEEEEEAVVVVDNLYLLGLKTKLDSSALQVVLLVLRVRSTERKRDTRSYAHIHDNAIRQVKELAGNR